MNISIKKRDVLWSYGSMSSYDGSKSLIIATLYLFLYT